MMTHQNLKVFSTDDKPFIQKKTHLNFVWNSVIDDAKYQVPVISKYLQIMDISDFKANSATGTVN